MTTDKIPAWQIMMDTTHKKIQRPRFFSLNTIAAMTRRKDLNRLAKELESSGKVAVCYCPIVKAYVFYSGPMIRIYGDYKSKWQYVKDFYDKYPYPAVKGFRAPTRMVDAIGLVSYGSPASSDPFIPEDYEYANTIIDNLRKAGYTPGIKKYKVANPA